MLADLSLIRPGWSSSKITELGGATVGRSLLLNADLFRTTSDVEEDVLEPTTAGSAGTLAVVMLSEAPQPIALQSLGPPCGQAFCSVTGAFLGRNWLPLHLLGSNAFLGVTF